MPAGVLVTVPWPSPATVTLRPIARRNVAVTVCGVSRVTVQGPVPLQPPPDHPENIALAAAVDVSVTLVPLGKLAVQGPPVPAFEQLMPAGELVTVPCPLPIS